MFCSLCYSCIQTFKMPDCSAVTAQAACKLLSICKLWLASSLSCLEFLNLRQNLYSLSGYSRQVPECLLVAVATRIFQAEAFSYASLECSRLLASTIFESFFFGSQPFTLSTSGWVKQNDSLMLMHAWLEIQCCLAILFRLHAITSYHWKGFCAHSIAA